MIMQMVSKLKYKILTGSKLSSFTSTYTSWTFFTVDKLMDRIYHLHHVNLLHKEKITFTWPLAVKTKILIYNRSKFPTGMGKDSLSELVCGSNTAHKAVCLGIKSAGGTICVCWLCRSPLPFARAPRTRPAETGTSARADGTRTIWAAALPGPVQGHRPVATLNVDSGREAQVRGCGTRQASGPPATRLHPDPRPPAHHEAGLWVLSCFVNC